MPMNDDLRKRQQMAVPETETEYAGPDMNPGTDVNLPQPGIMEQMGLNQPDPANLPPLPGEEQQPQQQLDANGLPVQQKQAIGEDELRRAMDTLRKYKGGKSNLERRIIASEQWWKQRHWAWMEQQGNPLDTRYTSGWLFNVIMNRHADAIQSVPQPNILPREEMDKETAKSLSSIVPCVLEENGFEEVYSDISYQKLKQGTGIYGVFWDSQKLNGLGDISIRKIDVLNLFWEPGITDIQKSKNVFHVELMDNDVLEEMYPQLKGQLRSNQIEPAHYIYDDHIDTTDKSVVVDWYYRTHKNGKTLLQYCKFVGTTVLYSSENDVEQPMMDQQVQMGTDIATGEPYMVNQQVPNGEPVSEVGWYAHGEYPFVFDRLFPVEGSPCGFGYIDVCKSAQEQIDLLNQAVIKNSLLVATPRFFIREDGGVNEREFADVTKPFVHVNSNLGEDTIRQIEPNALHGNYITILNNKVTEMKEISGNTDASNGVTGGVTAASGIAAQQEAAGKSSRAATMSAYRAFGRVINQVIELIRQFYDVPRQFRITGTNGQDEFTSFDNGAMKPQPQGMDFGIDMGYRKPVYDVKVSAQSKSVYTQNSQNEMAITLANLGVFNPQMVDQSLMLLDAMDFDGKDQIATKVAQFGTIYQMFAQVSQIALELANRYDPAIAEQLAMIIMQRQGAMPAAIPMGPNGPTPNGPNDAGGESNVDSVRPKGEKTRKETAGVRKAREHANNASQVTT